MEPTLLTNHLTGSLLGLDIGNAMGASVEFQSPGSFEPVTGFRSGGPFNLPAGYWTDDTSLALCSAESLVQCDGFDPEDHQYRFRRWYREGYLSSTGTCFDIGNQTRKAIHQFEQTGNLYVGAESHGSAGNGALMRFSMDSASSFFSRPFSSSKAYRRRASATSRPLYFLRHV